MIKKKIVKQTNKNARPLRDDFIQQLLGASSRKEVAQIIAKEASRVFTTHAAWVVILPPENGKVLMVEVPAKIQVPDFLQDDLIQWVAEKRTILSVAPGKKIQFEEINPKQQWHVPSGLKLLENRYQKSLIWMGAAFHEDCLCIASLNNPEKVARPTMNHGQTVLIIALSALTAQVKFEIQNFVQVARLAVGMSSEKKRLENRLRQTTSIAEIAQNINAILDLNILLRLIILEVTNAMRCQAGDIWMFDEGSSDLVCKISLGLSVELKHRPLAGNYTAQAMKTGESIWIETINGDDQLNPSLYATAGIVSMVIIPLKIKNKPIGVMHLYAKKQRAFHSEERLLLKTLVNQATTAIDNANLFEETKQRAQELLALYEVAQVISEVSNLDHALELIVTRVSEVLKVDKCWMMFLDKEKKKLCAHAAAVGFYDEQIADMCLPLSAQGISSQVFQTAREVFTNHAAQEPLVEAEFKKQFKLRNLMAVPLRGQEETFGVFFVANKKGGNLFKGNDVRLFRTMASEATVIIQNATLYNKLKNSYQSLIHVITGMIDAREPYTRGHSERVSAYCGLIAEQLRLPEEEIERIRMAGLMHDIGKIGIPENVLLKTGKLSPAEYAAMARHSEIGAQLLKNVELPWHIHDLILYHHEAFDGSGFPKGLQVDAIPLGAKIIAIADAYDVATKSEGHQPAMQPQVGYQMVLKRSGHQFDPKVVQAFEAVWPALSRLIENEAK